MACCTHLSFGSPTMGLLGESKTKLCQHSITAHSPTLPQCEYCSTADRSQKERDLLLLGERW